MHSKIYFHAHENDRRWIYLDLFGWLIFGWFKHGGWFYLNFSWFIRQLSEQINRQISIIRRRNK